jgi:hypothetical protein
MNSETLVITARLLEMREDDIPKIKRNEPVSPGTAILAIVP